MSHGQLVIGAPQVLNNGGLIRRDAGTAGGAVTITGSHLFGGELHNAATVAVRFLLDNCFPDQVTLRGPIVARDQMKKTRRPVAAHVVPVKHEDCMRNI